MKEEQDKKNLEKKQLIIERWLQINLGLQRFSYDTYASFQHMSLSIITVIPWCAYYLKARQDKTEGQNYTDFLFHLLILMCCEAAFFGLQKINFNQLLNRLKAKENDWLLQLELLEELSAGKYFPFPKTIDEQQAILALTESLSDASDKFMKIATGTALVGCIILVMLGYLILIVRRVDWIQFVCFSMLMLYNKKNKNLYFENLHSHYILTLQEKAKALEGITEALSKLDLQATTSAWCMVTHKNTLSVMLKYENLSPTHLLKLLATNAITARVLMGDVYWLVMSIPVNKIKSKDYSQYLDDVFSKANAIALELESVLQEIGALPKGWLSPYEHSKRYDYLLVEEQYFQDRNDFDKNKFVLEDGYYMIPFIDRKDLSMKKIKQWTRERVKTIEEKPTISNTQSNTDHPVFYGNVVNASVVKPICNKYRNKNKSNPVTKEIPVAKSITREINWGLTANSPYLDARQYTLLPLETTQGTHVVISHIWAAIPTTDLAEFKKYMFLLGDEWNAGYGIKRFEANAQDTGCYKTHDKSDDRYLLMPVQLGDYVSGSSSESRPLLLRLHTEECYSHKELNKKGIPTQRLKDELAEFQRKSLVLKK